MKRMAAIVAIAAAAAAVLLVATPMSPAQEAQPQPAQSTLVATIDLSPIQTQLAALRAEVAALRQAVTDPKGLREEVAQAAAATKALDARVGALAELVKAQGEAMRPALVALDPSTPWEYMVLRTRSESVANRLGRDGWYLVTASNDWLYFRRPLPGGKRRQGAAEGGKRE